MSKRAIRVPPLKAGRRVRWTFEVSADVGREDRARTKKASRKRRRVPRVTAVAATTSRAERVAPLVTSPVAHPPTPERRTLRLQSIAFAMVAIFVITLALSRRPSQAVVAADEQPERLVPSSDVASVPQPAPSAPTAAARVAVASVAAPRAISESSAKAAVSKPEKNRIAEAAAPVAAVTPSTEALGTEGSTTKPAASESINAEPTPVPADPVGSGRVTLTGCLEASASEDQFRLTGAEGGDAPRSRSWRTGFLKKRPTTVTLVAPPDPRALQTQVGQRVAATGLLTNRELRVTSVRAIGARCN
jgi:hypothetical protein